MDEPRLLSDAANDALAIYEGGACNPRRISRALTAALDLAAEAGHSRRGPELAPARLILSQLVYLLGGTWDCLGGYRGEGFEHATDVAECRRLVSAAKTAEASKN